MADILTNFYDDSYQMRFLNLKKPFFNVFSVQTAENVKSPKIVFDYISGSFFFKSPRNLKIGRGHGSDFVHIIFLNTLRHAKTKSEVLGPSLTWFWNNGRFNFLFLSKIAPLFFTFFCIIQIS